MTTTKHSSEQQARTPYDEAHVSYVREAGRVTVLYIPDPEQAKNPKAVLADLTNRDKYENVEVVATANRYYKRDGASFSGWIVEAGPQNHSDPIDTKPEAMHALKREVAAYFDRKTPAPEQHEVTRSLELEGEDVWDEPRTELTEAEVFGLRAGVVVEAKTVQGARCRLRLATSPTTAHEGTTFLEGPKAELYEALLDSVTLIGVMPRKGDTIHAQAKTYTAGPDGERVEGRSKVMRRKLDRDPWPGGPGNTVVSGGRGVDSVLTTTIVILADAPGKRTDEQVLARAVSLAMPGLDFRSNETSTSAVRIFAKRAEHEGRDDEDVLARNDDIAEAIALAGFYVCRRGAGQAVYAQVERSSHAANDGMCERADHTGQRAPWIAVLPGLMPLEHEYACRACVMAYVEHHRAIEHIDPERPYVVRMWDAAGHTLKVADDPKSLDFTGAATEAEARMIAEDIVTAGTGLGWLHQGGGRLLVDVAKVTIDRGTFTRFGELRAFGPIDLGASA